MDIKSLQELLENRASHRKFLPDPVPVEDIRQMIECARLAPSGHNYQPWRFVAVTDKELIKQMAQLLEDALQSIYPTLPQEVAEKLEGYKFFMKHFEQAPAVIAVLARENDYISSTLERDYGAKLPKAELLNMALLGVGAAINNLLLAAEAMGYGACWMIEPVVYGQQAIEKLLEVEEPYKFISLIPVGRPVKVKKGQPKKSVDEVLSIKE